jgi:hypothetical protein
MPEVRMIIRRLIAGLMRAAFATLGCMACSLVCSAA